METKNICLVCGEPIDDHETARYWGHNEDCGDSDICDCLTWSHFGCEPDLDVARDRISELESKNARLERLLANITADNLLIARLLSDVGIEHSGYSNQAQRVEMLIDNLRTSQHNVIAFAKERNDARRRITELEAQLAAALATRERPPW